ncbi:PepSY-like domain-containing protein [Pseudocnuella soli]|uniref:PepSY-like domain-containing protein n=1 Tax=Pseudocnuella soli TaxID=2502779 RepID=UPI001047D4F9|nr:PepSY-like domain-containing protein [Pseudocnuella soli]
MKLLGICVAFLGITLTACSQDIAADKVPSVVTNAVQAKFAGATKIDWEKKDKMYEAEFTQDSVEYTVEVDATGKITRQKHDLTLAQLPAGIAQAITAEYKDYELDDMEQVEVAGTIFYQVELEAPRGKKDVQLVFDANGAKSNTAYWD